MFRRFIRWLFGDEELEKTRSLLAELRVEVEDLREKLDRHLEAQSGEIYTNEDGEKVPMSQVISEYLYGKEERE